MKKLFAVLALVGVMTSCKDKKKEEKKPEETTTTTTTPTTTDATTAPVENTAPAENTGSAAMPKFADAEVQKYVEDYTAFVTTYVNAAKTKDMTKVATMTTSATQWTSKSMDIAKKLMANPDDATKFSNYMSKLSDQMTAAMPVK